MVFRVISIGLAIPLTLLLALNGDVRAAPALQASSAQIALPTVTAGPGDQVEVPIRATGIPQPGLAVFNLTIRLESSVEVVTVRGGDSPWENPIVNISGGEVRIANVRARGASGDFTLAVLVLRVPQSASGSIPLRLSSASGVSVNSSVMDLARVDGAINVGGQTTPTPPPPTPSPTQPPPPPPPPTQPPPTAAPTPPPTPAPTPTPMAPLPSPVTPTPDQEQATPVPAPGPTLVPPGNGPDGGSPDDGENGLSWTVTLSVVVDSAAADRLDAMLSEAGIQARTATGEVRPAAIEAGLVYEVPVDGITSSDRLVGPFNLALGALDLEGTDGSGYGAIAFAGSGGLSADARLVPDDGVLRIELYEPRIWVMSSIIRAHELEGANPHAGYVAAGFDVSLTGATEGGKVTVAFVGHNGGLGPQSVTQASRLTNGELGEDAAFAVEWSQEGLDGALGAVSVSLWAGVEWYDAQVEADKELVIARVSTNGEGPELRTADCNGGGTALVQCTVSFEDSLSGPVSYGLLAVSTETALGASESASSDQAAMPGVLVFLLAFGIAGAVVVWALRLVSIVRGHNG